MNSTDWISVNDRIPADGQSVLVINTLKQVYVASWSKSCLSHVAAITHWTFIPEPPELDPFEEWWTSLPNFVTTNTHDSCKISWDAALTWARKNKEKL
jgi:hypothetical protein